MTVLDAYAVLAYLKDEPAASEVRALLSDRDASLTAIGIAEVLDHLVRIVGADEEDAALDIAQLDLLDGIGLDSRTAVAAGRLRARHYHRTRCPVSLADCFAAEVARPQGHTLATSDPHLLDVYHAEGCPWSCSPGRLALAGHRALLERDAAYPAGCSVVSMVVAEWRPVGSNRHVEAEGRP